jgi:hypothetical protein
MIEDRKEKHTFDWEKGVRGHRRITLFPIFRTA